MNLKFVLAHEVFACNSKAKTKKYYASQSVADRTFHLQYLIFFWGGGCLYFLKKNSCRKKKNKKICICFL